MIAITAAQAEFYREFLMARGQFDPHDFGVALTRDELTDQMAERFNATFRGNITIDELLLHPADALRFCQDVRLATGWFDLPDDIILRVILTRRKNPAG